MGGRDLGPFSPAPGTYPGLGGSKNYQKIYHDMDGNPTMDGIPTTSQAHVPHTVALETSRISNAIVLLNLGCLKQSTSSLNDRKNSFYNSLDGFPTIKISQKTQKANSRPNSSNNLA